ncbi:MAG: FMN-binding negative transcriptional regulator [Corynebacteriales bacterium]|nr:FMN-binding negative transcriptional regulator [Mycobacteriales bacterium]
MLVLPWDANLDETEWQNWIGNGHDFGHLAVNGLPGDPPMVVPTHFVHDNNDLLIHLARPNPVWKAIEHDPNVTFTVTSDYAFIPGTWRVDAHTPPAEGIATSYYATVQFNCHAVIIDDTEAKAELLRRQLAHFQPAGDYRPIIADQPPYARMLPGIRGLKLRVNNVRAKFKYDDNKPVEHRTAVAERLIARGQGLDASTAREQLRRLDRIGTWESSPAKPGA